jgi:UDP-N-acetylmuramate--alanine ligase
LDYYKSFENLQAAFMGFAQKVPFYGTVIACGDDPQIRNVFEHFPKRIQLYGFDESNDYVLKGGRGHYELWHAGQKRGDFAVAVPGLHNALNATAALIAGLSAGISWETCRQGLAKYTGVDRRFHLKGEVQGITVYDDYGHHPTEVRATLQGFREKFPDRRLVVYFQPHRYSRTQICWHDFTSCFSQCDELVITDIYAAGEKPIEGISSERLVKEIRHPGVRYWPKTDTISGALCEVLKPGDVFLTLGAGDGWKVGMDVLARLHCV